MSEIGLIKPVVRIPKKPHSAFYKLINSEANATCPICGCEFYRNSNNKTIYCRDYCNQIARRKGLIDTHPRHDQVYRSFLVLLTMEQTIESLISLTGYSDAGVRKKLQYLLKQNLITKIEKGIKHVYKAKKEEELTL